MRVARLVADDDAVSPVIGIILMVAITVILAAVIGTFVLGIGQGTSSPTPQASWEFGFDAGGDGSFSGSNDDSLTVIHRGGDSIEEALTVQVDGERVDTAGGLNYTGGAPSPPVGAGDSITVEEDGANSIESGDRVFVIYRPDKPEFRALIGEGVVPD